MNTIDDLRATLDGHAEALPDTERYVRPVAVRARIRAARRRRTATVAVAAAVLLVASTVTVLSTVSGRHDLDPAGPSVVGVQVPRQIDVLGFPYAVETTRSLGSGGRVELADSGRSRAVLLAGHSLGTGSATLFLYGEPVARVRGQEQVSVPVTVGQGDLELRVRLDGAAADATAGVAVYDTTEELAPGVSDGEVVFRDEVAGNSLITAAFSDGDTAEATVHFRGRLDQRGLADYCNPDPGEKGLWLNVSLDGHPASGTTCRDDGSRDPGGNWSTFDGTKSRAHTVEVYLTRGSRGPRVSSGAQVGLGVYDVSVPSVSVLGADVPRRVESMGRTWVLDRVESSGSATVDTAGGDRMLGVVSAGRRVWASYRGRLLHGETTSMSSAVRLGPGFGWGEVLLAGDRYRVRVQTSSPSAYGALVIYRPL